MDENKRLADKIIANALTEEYTGYGTVYENIEYNEDLTEFNLYVDGETYNISTTIMEFVYFRLGMEYQITAGVSLEDIDIRCNFIDSKTQEVLYSESYKETEAIAAADQKASEEAAQEAIDSEMEKQ